MSQYNPGSLPEPKGGDLQTWAKQLTNQLRVELVALSKLLKQTATNTETIKTVVSGGGGGSSVSSPHNLLSTTHPDTASGSPVLGDILAADATPAWGKVSGNTTTTKKFLSQTGDGTNSALPVWDDLPTILTHQQVMSRIFLES